MSELLSAWKAFKTERSVALCPTTLRSDYQQVERWLERCPVTDLDRGREAMLWILQQQPRKSSIRVAGYLRSLYRWATSDGVELVSRNPVATVRMPKPAQADDVVVIPRSELPLVLGALGPIGKRRRVTTDKPRWHLWAELQLQTAMRTGEVRAIRLADIDGDRLQVHSNYTLTHGLKDSTKTSKARTVPLNPVARQILADLAETADGEGYLFPWNRYAYQSFFAARMRVAHERGVISQRYRPYDLRHTAISAWLEAGVPVAQVAAWAGNSAEVIWRHYANATETYEVPTL